MVAASSPSSSVPRICPFRAERLVRDTLNISLLLHGKSTRMGSSILPDAPLTPSPPFPTNSNQHNGQAVSLFVTPSTQAANLGIQMNLLFVTQSSNKKSKKETEKDRREINRRAQQNAFLKRKQARKEASAQIPQPIPSRTLGWGGEKTKQTPSEQLWPQSSSLTNTFNPSPDYDAPSVRSYLDSSRLDPFNQGRVKMSPQMESIFMYYFTVIMPAVEPVLAEREGYNQWLVPLSLENPALLYSLIGCMAYDIEQASVTGFGPTSRRNMVTERVQYRIHAIQALNECLADPKTARKPSTLVAVHFLLWQEVRRILYANDLREVLPANPAFPRSSLETSAYTSTAFKGCWS